MCGKFQLDLQEDELAALCHKAEYLSGLSIPRKEEISPGDLAPVLFWQNGAAAGAMLWGFPPKRGKGLIFTAKLENADQQSLFAGAMRQSRAAIPCSGFFDWKERTGAKTKRKLLFRDREQPIFWLAGFYANFPKQDGSGPARFVILTSGTTGSPSSYRAPMPLLLRRDQLEPWLREAALPSDQANLKATLI